MSSILHLLLAIALTSFLVLQAGALAAVLRSRRELRAGRRARSTEVLWSAIPVLVVLFLATRSWIAAFEVDRPAVASVPPPAVTRSAGAPPSLQP